MSVLTHFPKNRLTELVGRFGGLTRDDAVEAATHEIEILRPEADKRIEAGIAELERILSEAGRGGASPEMMISLLPVADQVVTLAGTYGYEALDHATKNLCDLLDGLISQKKNDLASIRVHVQTIRMVTPSSPQLPAQHVEVLLLELQKVLDHHGVVPPPPDQGSETAQSGAKELKLV
jgi:hypothetical protein